MRDGAAAGPPVRVKTSIGDVSLVGITGTGSLLYTQTIGTQDVFVADLDGSGGPLPTSPPGPGRRSRAAVRS